MAYLSHNLKVGFYKLYFLNLNATQVEFLSQNTVDQVFQDKKRRSNTKEWFLFIKFCFF